MTLDADGLALLGFLGLYAAIVYFGMFRSSNSYRIGNTRKRFGPAFLSICEGTSTAEKRLVRLEKWHSRYRQLSGFGRRGYQDASDLLEDFVYYAETYGGAQFSKTFKIENTEELRASAYELLELSTAARPFRSVPSPENLHLGNAMTAVTDHNMKLGESALRQLATAITTNRRRAAELERNQRYSYAIAVISVGVSVFFGVLALTDFRLS